MRFDKGKKEIQVNFALIRRCGGTFPQGKVKNKTLSWERVAGRSPDGRVGFPRFSDGKRKRSNKLLLSNERR